MFTSFKFYINWIFLLVPQEPRMYIITAILNFNKKININSSEIICRRRDKNNLHSIKSRCFTLSAVELVERQRPTNCSSAETDRRGRLTLEGHLLLLFLFTVEGYSSWRTIRTRRANRKLSTIVTWNIKSQIFVSSLTKLSKWILVFRIFFYLLALHFACKNFL